MPIVINEFELLVEPPPSPNSQPPGPASGTEQAQLRPDEIVTVMEVHEERRQRVRAD
jgi:hypothetical protein